MPPLENLKFDSGSFSGVARLFPLPNLVMFPHVLQPLHIFEPRYCDLLEAALADDRLIAMAVLAPGWEKNYEGRPPIHPVACLGQIATHVRLPDGRHNLLLAGLARVQLGTELPATTSYRSAPARLLDDEHPPAPAAAVESLRQKLLAQFRTRLPDNKEAQGPLAQLMHSGIDLGVLTDIIAYTLDMDLDSKVELLTERNVHARAERLLGLLSGGRSASRAGFPPEFSAN
ncbi:MAG TPA: LON peptidase substrate-binding domain-containing protein [Pirellulales bacterium]|nr:LON peptidase substrate-binding domain-containing protein [Pirellulales bacterium]